ncbi:MAG TPA: protein kinase [Vicinamibacterales bacterium]
MPFLPGARLGSFEIISRIGAGGMGEVYHARDTRLQRDVALKVLLDAVAGDPERLARFEREARTLASLNHPNIAHIHGVELAEGSGPALIMELVDGDELTARIEHGPVPVDEAVAIARQIAEALDAAHSLGIVHRDLKPANVKIRRDGTVKVLDFGLAKALDAGGAAPPMSNSPTITSPAAMTMMGVILGTAAYMSPEQARGRAVDKRADIWAFGCLLYEMLTGRPVFEGETITDVLGAIVKSDPDWTRLPPPTPPRIAGLLRHCLTKDPARRLRDIGDAITVLDAADDGAAAAAAPRGSRARTAALWAASILLVGVAAGATGYVARHPGDAPVLKYHIALQTDGGAIRDPAISPDGRRVAYVGGARLWVQELDAWKARELAGTEAPSQPFWSPDGAWIAYFRSEALLKVSAAGGPVVRVATLPAAQGRFGSSSGAWEPDGTITISMGSGPLLRVPSSGGQPVTIDLQEQDLIGFRDLQVLPGGGIVGGVQKPTGIIGLAVLRGGRLNSVLDLPGVRHASYSSTGHLVFQHMAPGPSIWAVRFDPDTLQRKGEPFVVGPGSEPSAGGAATLAFQGAEESLLRQLAWFTMDGTLGPRIGEPREWNEGVAISPDGRRVLASAVDGIWLYDVSSGARSRVTTGADDVSPVWLPDGMMAFVRYAPDPVLMIKPASSLGGETALVEGARFPRVTADGRRIVFNTRERGRAMWEVAWLDLENPRIVRKLDAVHQGARFPSVSPDGKLVAYISGEMGHDEVFVTRLPGGEGKWQVSSDGGGWTYFSPKGDGVFYRALDGGLMFVPISQKGTDVDIGAARRLFEWGSGWAPFYDLALDGRRGIAAVPVGRALTVRSLSVIQNWHREFPDR